MEAERKLIGDYQDAVRKAVSALRTGYGHDDLLKAWRSRKIPKDGVINGIEHTFHGAGCRATVDGLEVDFDFGPDGRIDGFDAWRLWLFARERPVAYPQFQQLECVEKALKMLADSGEIECPETPPSDHLWYMKF